MAMDYEKLGLKSGIEIHQQLEGRKLFCNCPTIIIDDEPDFQAHRNLRAVIGETGEIDKAALHEQERKKDFVYNYYEKNCCLIDLDEEPPKPINSDAVKTSFIVAKMLNAKIVDEIQVMRKTVVDGSNTTGFQRTALVAMDGEIETTYGNVGIETVCLEEDAAKIVERTEQRDIYNLSRLGIPLIEIATAPDMKTPKAVRSAAEKIGMILRSTGCCRRGLGTIRQDVNVSIKGGNRVEIKGAQDLKTMEKVVEFEAQRQHSIITDLKGKIDFKEFKDYEKKKTRAFQPVGDVFKKTECKFIKKAIDSKKQSNFQVGALKLSGMKGQFGKELNPGNRLGTELSKYLSVKLGLGIIHSDEGLEKYKISKKEISEINKSLKINEDKDLLVITVNNSKVEWATPNEKAFEVIMERLAMFNKGVPNEVRKANADATTTYMRPMPGGARMYPETDVTPLKMKFDDIEMPEMIDEKAARYEKLGLSKDLSWDMAKSDYSSLFEKLIKDKNLKPAFIAETLVSFRAELVRNYKGSNPDLVDDEILSEIFNALSQCKISKDSVLEVIVEVAKGNGFDVSKFKTLSKEELEKGIKEIIAKNKGAPFGAVMGQVMAKYRGKADGQLVSELVKKLAK